MTSALVKDESMLTTYFNGYSNYIYSLTVDGKPLLDSRGREPVRALGYSKHTENCACY